MTKKRFLARKFYVSIYIVCILIVLAIAESTLGTDWQSSGQFSQGVVNFHFDNGGIWNRTGTMIFPANHGDNLNITGTYYGDGSGLTGVVAGSAVVNDVFVNESGDWMTGSLNMTGNSLTDVGTLIVQTIVFSGDLVPLTDSLYSLGNSTNRFSSLYAEKIYSTNIFSSEVNTTNLTSQNIFSESIDSNNVSSEIINLGTFKVLNESEAVVIYI